MLSEAGAAFRARLDAEIWPKDAPWERPRKPGHLDFWRIHCAALDRLDELLALLLPNGREGSTALGELVWVGLLPHWQGIIFVNLMTGAWNEPAAERGGRDLIGLAARMGGMGQGQAARWLAEWTGIEGRRHA